MIKFNKYDLVQVINPQHPEFGLVLQVDDPKEQKLLCFQKVMCKPGAAYLFVQPDDVKLVGISCVGMDHGLDEDEAKGG